MVKPTGGDLRFLLEPLEGVTELSLASIGQTSWRCLIRGGRRWTAEYASVEFDDINIEVRPANQCEGLVKEEGGTFALTFNWDGDNCFGDVLDILGRNTSASLYEEGVRIFG